MMTEFKIGDRVSWRKREYSQMDPQRGGDGTVVAMTRNTVTIETVCFPPGEFQRLTFRCDDVTLTKSRA
ncbi:MAG TPA: hypothetical protein VJP85_05670 [Candidatus Baltobacteraceae bacterium]|nr:hypothetical protein [Candidatus Baltobacteraceae bacterium]